MMDFHGANKPTGESRTWPNELSREAIRGMENRPPWEPADAILPFTRYLAGHADYTPVHFGKRMGELSWAQHVATMVIFTSPLMCLGADPQSVLDNPCNKMIQSIPPTWDETIVLPQSKIGELVLFARRKGATWFLAAMNGTTTPTTLHVPLSFLKFGNYKFSSVKDDKQKQANAILENGNITSKTIITIDLNATGGYVGRFSPL
jgi:alpha-glucosidase